MNSGVLAKLIELDEVLVVARPPARLAELAYLRMRQVHELYGDEWMTADLLTYEDEEDADKLCYRAMRLLKGERLTRKQRIGWWLWGIALRLMDAGGR